MVACVVSWSLRFIMRIGNEDQHLLHSWASGSALGTLGQFHCHSQTNSRKVVAPFRGRGCPITSKPLVGWHHPPYLSLPCRALSIPKPCSSTSAASVPAGPTFDSRVQHHASFQTCVHQQLTPRYLFSSFMAGMRCKRLANVFGSCEWAGELPLGSPAGFT